MSFKNRSARFEDNIKMDFEGIITEDVDLFHLAQDRAKGECFL